MIRTASRSLMGNLTARRVGLTYIVEVSFRSPNPGRAAGVANAIVDAYILDQLESKYQTTRRASVWLQERIKICGRRPPRPSGRCSISRSRTTSSIPAAAR